MTLLPHVVLIKLDFLFYELIRDFFDKRKSNNMIMIRFELVSSKKKKKSIVLIIYDLTSLHYHFENLNIYIISVKILTFFQTFCFYLRLFLYKNNFLIIEFIQFIY